MRTARGGFADRYTFTPPDIAAGIRLFRDLDTEDNEP
jgi:hypothetical protein